MPAVYGPPKSLYNRFVRRGHIGIFAALAGSSEATDTVTLDETHLKAHRTAASIERMFGRLKDWRRIATRYDAPTHS